MKNILGIHDGHNASACLMIGGEVKWVIQEERIRREKNFDGFPRQAIEFILKKEKLSVDDIYAVVLNGVHQPKPMSRIERLESFKSLATQKQVVKAKLKNIKLLDDLYIGQNNKDRMKNLYQMGFEKKQISFVDHHTAHAASAYFGYGKLDEDVLILTNDGAGDRLCATVSIGREGKITRLQEVGENHSIGLLYAMFTFLTGMVPLEHEYKLMGMAPYADQKGARKVADEFHAMFKVSDNGLSWIFLNGNSIYQSLEYFKEFMYLKRFDHLMAGLQLFVEEFLTSWVRSAIKETGVKNIALAGGTFMNVKANQKIMELDELDNLFVFPSCGDEANAVGVAYHYYAHTLGESNISEITDVYWGIEWEDSEIKLAFEDYTFKQDVVIDYCDDIEKKVAEVLAEGHVVARFKGREEFGARSLGNRAILANPSKPSVIKEINEMIKNRDFWMPFASSILFEHMDDYVEWNPEKYEPYFMIMTYDTKKLAHTALAGGIHPYDKTVRPQCVLREHNKDYWRLINYFHDLTGIAGVVNTSLNLHGLPLVYCPKDAFDVLNNSGLSYLAIGNFLIKKVSDSDVSGNS